MALVYFYNNASNTHVMNKDLTQLGSADVQFKEPFDIAKPVIYLAHDSSILKANYCYISWVNRYYYGHMEGENGINMRFYCDASDPLMSFKDAILASPAVVSRNPWHFDLYVPDSNLPVEARTASAVLKFPEQTKFDGRNNCYILTTIGAG